MNYNEKARTNYFKVKDMDALQRFVRIAGAYITAGSGGDDGIRERWEKDKGLRVAIIASEGIPPEGFDKDEDDDVEIDFAAAVCDFLADDEILILQGSGSEGMRYMTGWATAFNNKGETTMIDINDIYAKAAEFFKVQEGSITKCSY